MGPMPMQMPAVHPQMGPMQMPAVPLQQMWSGSPARQGLAFGAVPVPQQLSPGSPGMPVSPGMGLPMMGSTMQGGIPRLPGSVPMTVPMQAMQQPQVPEPVMGPKETASIDTMYECMKTLVGCNPGAELPQELMNKYADLLRDLAWAKHQQQKASAAQASELVQPVTPVEPGQQPGQTSEQVVEQPAQQRQEANVPDKKVVIDVEVAEPKAALDERESVTTTSPSPSPEKEAASGHRNGGSTV